MIQALAMTVIPSVKAHLVTNHLFQIFFSTGTLLAFYHVLRQFWASSYALIYTGFFASFPMFHCLTATINMDMPTLFFSLLATYFYLRKWRGLMVIALIAGVMTKQSIAIGVIAIS